MRNFISHNATLRRATPYIPYMVAGAVTLGCLAAAPFVLKRKSKALKHPVREAKKMRENLSEHDIDKTLKDSFPASDPPGWY